MPTIKDAESAAHVCPFNDFSSCFGPQCMAWVWSGPAFDRCTTDNLVETAEGITPIGDPPLPEGHGWAADGQPMAKSYHRRAKDGKPSGTAQQWIRPREQAHGHCGRVGMDHDYNIPY